MNDIRLAFRHLLKAPGFTTVAILTLALGVGVNTSMFTALRALLARSLPYPDPEGLVQVVQTAADSKWRMHHSVPNFLDYQENGGFQQMAAMTDKPFSLSQPGQPAERVQGLKVTAGFFPLLGIQPELGRWFTPDEDRPGANKVVVLDHGFWQSRYAGDRNILGRTIRLDGEPVTVIGVMPARFQDLLLMGTASLWVPFAFTDVQRTERGHHFLKCLARISSGTSLQEAQARTTQLAARQLKAYPQSSPVGLKLVRLAEAKVPPEDHKMLWALLALSGFVLLIACANLANLQFARTAMREREIAIRGALGAPRGRILGLLMAESLLIALLGGAAGLLLSSWTNDLLTRQFLMEGKTVLNLTLNPGVLGFALAASCISGLAFGMVPAWMASRTDIHESIKNESRGGTGGRLQQRLQRALIVSEVALAMTLLASAGLMVEGLRQFASLNPGWKPDGMSLGFLDLPERKYAGAESRREFAERLVERLQALPGVQQAAVCWNLPLRQFNATTSFNLDGDTRQDRNWPRECFLNGVSPGYFTTLGMQVLEGRDFTAADSQEAPRVVIINQRMARTFWPEGSALGRKLDGAEIVGVVADVRFPANPTESKTPFQTYRPFAQSPSGWLSLAVRGNISAEGIRRTVAELDPDLPVGKPGPVRASVGESLDGWAVGGKVLSLFALLGLGLSGLGIYGLVSGFVARRTREIGVRMALGAGISDVLRLVIGNGLKLSLAGLAIGMLGALGMARLLVAVLPGLPAPNPLILLLVGMALLSVAAFASWLPARRAARVDPMVALRND